LVHPGKPDGFKRLVQSSETGSKVFGRSDESLFASLAEELPAIHVEFERLCCYILRDIVCTSDYIWTSRSILTWYGKHSAIGYGILHPFINRRLRGKPFALHLEPVSFCPKILYILRFDCTELM
jgi:hypothetical protein